MSIMRQIRSVETRDDLFEYEMHIEACADEMGVTRDEYIDHTQRDYYATLPYPYHPNYTIHFQELSDESAQRR